MKKIRLTNEKLLAAFNILNAATYKQMDDGDKIKLWRIVRAMKPSATQFEEASKDAAEKLKPEGIEAMLEKAREYYSMLGRKNLSNYRCSCARARRAALPRAPCR